MLTFALFLLSGAALATLTIAKRVEEKKKRTPAVLRAVSIGDERVRHLHNEILRQYSTAKEKSAFWVKKQLPLKVKSNLNKLHAYAKEKGVEYMGDMRDSRLIKKSDGISEFFKNISEIEKGTGEINESLPEGLENEFRIETSVEKPVEVKETRIETVISSEVEEKPVHVVTEMAPVVEIELKPKKKRAYKPRAKKLAVVEIAD